jgi:tetratricopeptide (TPR) repeat protein
MVEELEPLAGTTATLLAATALGGSDQLAAWPGLARLVALLHQTAVADPALRAALEAVAAAPEDPVEVAALARAVTAGTASDTRLRAELARLLDQAGQHPTAGGLVTQIAGHARVGKLVTIGRAGQVHVHLPPPPPATVLDQLPPTRVGPVVANLPPRNPNFTGRAELLDQLHQRLHPGQPAAVVQAQAQTLHGLGGVGKTQLALEYAHRHQADYDLIWWVAAAPSIAIPGQLVGLARRLGLPEHPEQAETIGVLWDALRRRDRWLLVFDNAEDPNDLRTWWPPGSGRVLVTSRHPTWAGPASTLAVDVLPRMEAVAFLQHRLGRDDPSLVGLAAALGDLPLALEQAAAYLQATATTPSEYLDLLDTRARELFTLGRPATNEHTIATTWTVSLRRLREQTPAAEDLLVLLAFLAADDIPRTLLTQRPRRRWRQRRSPNSRRLAATLQDPLAYQQVVGALRRYSLIKTSRDGQALSVHRLVQAVTRHQLDRKQERQWVTATLHLLRAAFPGLPDDPAAWPDYARLLPHALVVTDHATRLSVEPETTSWLLHQAGRYLAGRADYLQAGSLHERALAIRETHLSPDHPATAISLSDLANVLRVQGDLDRSRSLLERALAIRETRLGPNYPDIAQSLSDLANVIHDQGDLAGARSLHERALAIREAHLGPDHPDTAISLNNLANVLHNQGDLDRSRSLHERVLAIRETRLGPDHPHAATSLHNLADVLRDQGDLAGARSLLERALTICEARLVRDHPLTAFSLNTLALVLRDQGDLDRARSLLERALAIREARLGADHPYTAISLHNLAGVLHAQGDLPGAKEKLERALAIREARLGPDHPDTIRSRERLAAAVAALENRQ